jgi:hypothetical protein
MVLEKSLPVEKDYSYDNVVLKVFMRASPFRVRPTLFPACGREGDRAKR